VDSLQSPPFGDNRYVLIDLTLSNKGEGTTGFRVCALTLVDPGGVAYAPADCGVLPNPLFEYTNTYARVEVPAGGSVNGQVCFELAPGDGAHILRFGRGAFSSGLDMVLPPAK
jgi:hypothetical protein